MRQEHDFDEVIYKINNDQNLKYGNYINNNKLYANANNIITSIFSDINKIITEAEEHNNIAFVFETNDLTEFIVQIRYYSIIYKNQNTIRYIVDSTDHNMIVSIWFGDGSAKHISSNLLSILNFVNSVAFYITDYDIYKDGKFDKNLLPTITLRKNMFSENIWNSILKVVNRDGDKELEMIIVYKCDLYNIFSSINKKDMA